MKSRRVFGRLREDVAAIGVDAGHSRAAKPVPAGVGDHHRNFQFLELAGEKPIAQGEAPTMRTPGVTAEIEVQAPGKPTETEAVEDDRREHHEEGEGDHFVAVEITEVDQRRAEKP